MGIVSQCMTLHADSSVGGSSRASENTFADHPIAFPRRIPLLSKQNCPFNIGTPLRGLTPHNAPHIVEPGMLGIKSEAFTAHAQGLLVLIQFPQGKGRKFEAMAHQVPKVRIIP